GTADPAVVAPNAGAGAPSPTTGRDVVILQQHIDLIVGRQIVRKVPIPGSAVTLPELAWLVRDSGWIEVAPGGLFVLHASIVQAPGTSLSITAPDVALIRLQGPGLSISGERS